MAKIFVDGKQYDASPEKNLLQALTELGFNIPYFCWHPALGSVGACRQCAVKTYRDENDTQGKIVMSCMTPVTEGLRVSVGDPEVIEFRRRVIEWLMINHPHDCPVCDEGGECHLQDMTVACGHNYRRYRGLKRTYRNQNLGPFVNHEMNRCIQCYRCVRFYRDYAGGRDFDAFASKDHVYFGRHQDGALESEFSGNLVEVCPTGVFTDKTLLHHYTRKWDLETAPSVCVHCGLGCNTIPGARYGLLRRIYARYNHAVNGYFLCDRGRYGYEFVNGEARLRHPRAGKGEMRLLSWEEATQRASEILRNCKRVLGVGSPRASLEANYALKRLVGEDAFSPGLSAIEQENIGEALALLRAGPARSASLAEVETADAILVLGSDPTNEAPLFDLAIRRAMHKASLEATRRLGIPDWNDYAVRDALHGARGELIIASSAETKLDRESTAFWRLSPPELSELAWGVAAALQGDGVGEGSPAAQIANALAAAKQPLVVVGVQSKALLQAAASICRLLSAGRKNPCLISIVMPECNSLGVTLLGGRSVEELLEEISAGQADALIVLENDLSRRASSPRLLTALSKLNCLITIDSIVTQTSVAADLALPAAAFAESMGTLVNSEGRAQRFYQVFTPSGEMRPSWQILRDLIETLRPGEAQWSIAEDVTRALPAEYPALGGALRAAPPASWRAPAGSKIPREPHCYSGRTAKNANLSVFEPQPPADPESPLAFSMEGFPGQPPAALAPRFWYPGWNSVQSLNKFQIEIGGQLRGGPIGQRLIEPGASEGVSLVRPEIEQLGEGELWLIPRAVIYGSEELSRLAPGVASLIPPAAIRLHPRDAAAHSLTDGEMARVEVAGEMFSLPVKLDAGVARGVAVIPAGYPETAGITRISRVKIEKAP